MGLISEIIDLLKLIIRQDWQKLKEYEVPHSVYKKAKKRLHEKSAKIGDKIHVVGKHFFYKIWFKSKHNWVFYRRKK